MRSPAVPRSAISLRSPVAIRRPSGIFPGGKVFQLPPPVVDANVPMSGAPGCTGWALTGLRLAELELAFSPAQEAAMFGRSALALAAPVQGSIFPRPLLVSPTLKVAGSVCL